MDSATRPEDQSAQTARTPLTPLVTQHIVQTLSRLKHGQVTITIHDGQVVQVDCVQQTRLFRSKIRK
jgi:hypothetical protein